MAIDEDIKRQEDELAALKATQVIAGSKVPIKTSSSGNLSGSVTFNGGAFERTITFNTTSGYHFMNFAVSSFNQTSEVGVVGVESFSLYVLPQDGSGSIRMKFVTNASWQQGTYPPAKTANFTYSITGFGDATGTFTVS